MNAYRQMPEAEDRPAATPFKLLRVADVLAMPAIDWMVQNALPRSGMAAVFGLPGCGKGFLCLHLAAAIAEERECFGRRTKKGRVVYVALEGQAGFSQRLQAWEEANGRPFPEGVRFVFEPFQLTKPEDLMGLAAAIDAEGGADVTLLDTLNRAAPGIDENSSQDMGRTLEACRQLLERVGGLLTLVHHAGKDATKGMRGHSSLYAALDAVIEVSRSGEKREWKVSKSKDGEDGQAHPFRLRSIHLGEDEYGDPISSCVVESDLVLDDPAPRIKLPKGGNQKIVFDALCPLFRESGTFGRAGAPPTRPCISLDTAIAGSRDRLTVSPDRRTERARQAITGLVSSGVLGLNEDWLWMK